MKVLIENKFKIIKIINVKNEYNKKFFIACLKISLLLNEKNLLKFF